MDVSLCDDFYLRTSDARPYRRTIDRGCRGGHWPSAKHAPPIGAVGLLHSTSQTNAEILDELLTKWENEGYVFKSIDALFREGH